MLGGLVGCDMIKKVIINTKTAMQKFKRVRQSIIFRRLSNAQLLVAIGCLLTGGIAGPLVYADQYTQQIQQLQSQNSNTQATISSLQSQASSYQAEISQLDSQIASLQQNIVANEAQQAQIQQQILAANQELAQKKQQLGADIEAMYVNGQMTTIEELATSKSLSAFVDAETYRNAVQGQIQNTLNTVTKLESQLKVQQNQISQLLQSQQGQQTQLNAVQQQQQQLLAYNQTQQSQYNSQIQANQAQIQKLEQEEIAANQSGVRGTSSAGVSCGGTATASYNGVSYSYTNTYPNSLCSIAQDSVTDQWGMLNRECVSYAAWMEASTGHSVPYGLGNATDWPSNVPSSWVSNTPAVGDIAIRPAIPGLSIDGESDVGHAMYVQQVLDSSTIVVSEYNENLNGEFSVQVRSIDAPYNGYLDNLVFIHFPTN